MSTGRCWNDVDQAFGVTVICSTLKAISQIEFGTTLLNLLRFGLKSCVQVVLSDERP